MATYYGWWIRLLVVLQLIFSIVALYALDMVGRTVILAADNATPTCPEGIKSYMTMETSRRCIAEIAELYVPKWANIASRIAVPAYLLCFSGGLILKNAFKKQKSHVPRWKSVDFQVLILGITLLIHLVVFPNNWLWLFRYIVLGMEHTFT